MTEGFIFDRVRSPSQVVADLAEKGIVVSERTLRQRARQIGAFHQIGRAVFFTDEDLERIITPDPKPELSPPTSDFAKRAQRRREKEALLQDAAVKQERPVPGGPLKRPQATPAIPWHREKPKP